MTLDEAIQHAEEVAEDKETRAKECIVKANSNNEWLFDYEVRKLNEESVSCAECAAEHRQLAEWLKDYKRLLGQEPYEDAISRQAVENITWQEPSYTDALNVLTEVREKIRALPSVTPAKDPLSGEDDTYDKGYQDGYECGAMRRIGRWIKNEYLEGSCVCSLCFVSKFEKSNYCPNCGCRMVEPQESEGAE